MSALWRGWRREGRARRSRLNFADIDIYNRKGLFAIHLLKVVEGADGVSDFVGKWRDGVGGAERGNAAPYLVEMPIALGVPTPDPAGAGSGENDYVFERAVKGAMPTSSSATRPSSAARTCGRISMRAMPRRFGAPIPVRLATLEAPVGLVPRPIPGVRRPAFPPDRYEQPLALQATLARAGEPLASVDLARRFSGGARLTPRIDRF